MAVPPAAPGNEHIEVVYSELDFHVQKDIHSVFRSTLKESQLLDEEQLRRHLSQVLKEHADKTISPGWSCIVGSEYSAAFAYDGHIHHFLASRHAVLLFRCV